MTASLAETFPNLSRAAAWRPIQARFEFRETPPLEALIGNVNLAPYLGEQWVVIGLQSGEWEIPGGTLEPGEHYLDTLRRELWEEVGAILLSFKTIGAWRCHSTAPKPYRPHLPHPDFYRLAGYGEIELVSRPQNPRGGEQVKVVEPLPLATVMQRFRSINRPDLAELYQLAALPREKEARG